MEAAWREKVTANEFVFASEMERASPVKTVIKGGLAGAVMVMETGDEVRRRPAESRAVAVNEWVPGVVALHWNTPLAALKLPIFSVRFQPDTFSNFRLVCSRSAHTFHLHA